MIFTSQLMRNYMRCVGISVQQRAFRNKAMQICPPSSLTGAKQDIFRLEITVNHINFRLCKKIQGYKDIMSKFSDIS